MIGGGDSALSAGFGGVSDGQRCTSAPRRAAQRLVNEDRARQRQPPKRRRLVVPGLQEMQVRI